MYVCMYICINACKGDNNFRSFHRRRDRCQMRCLALRVRKTRSQGWNSRKPDSEAELALSTRGAAMCTVCLSGNQAQSINWPSSPYVITWRVGRAICFKRSIFESIRPWVGREQKDYDSAVWHPQHSLHFWNRNMWSMMLISGDLCYHPSWGKQRQRHHV